MPTTTPSQSYRQVNTHFQPQKDSTGISKHTDVLREILFVALNFRDTNILHGVSPQAFWADEMPCSDPAAIIEIGAAGCSILLTSSSDEKLRAVQVLPGFEHIPTIKYVAAPDKHNEAIKTNSGVGVDTMRENRGTSSAVIGVEAAKRGGTRSATDGGRTGGFPGELMLDRRERLE